MSFDCFNFDLTLQIYIPFLCSVLGISFLLPYVVIILYNVCVDSSTCLPISLLAILSCLPDLSSRIISLFLTAHPSEVSLEKICWWQTLFVHLKRKLRFAFALKDSFAKFTILGWQLFSLSALKIFSLRGVLFNYPFFVGGMSFLCSCF